MILMGKDDSFMSFVDRHLKQYWALGGWVAQSIKGADSADPTWDLPLPLSLCPSPACVATVSQNK